MAKAKIGLVKTNYVPGKPKITSQGRSKNTNLGQPVVMDAKSVIAVKVHEIFE